MTTPNQAALVAAVGPMSNVYALSDEIDRRVASGGGAYTLPVATGSVLGGVKQGAGVTVAGDGTLSVPVAGTSSGTFAAGNDTRITGAAQLSALATVATSGAYTDLSGKPTIPSAYTLPVATTSVLGGVKQGAGASIAGDGTLSVPRDFDIGITRPGAPSNGERLLVYTLPSVMVLPASLTGSSATALTAATASAAFVFAYKRGGTTTTIATFTFAASGTSATISGVTIPTLQAGDLLLLTAPATADTTLADVGFTIHGTKP